MLCNDFFCRFREICLEYPEKCAPLSCDTLAHFNYNIGSCRLVYNYEYCSICEHVRFSFPDDNSIIMRCSFE